MKGLPKGSSLPSRLRSEFGFVTGNFAVMLTSWLVMDFFSELPGTYYPLYVKALGGTASSLGLIQASMNVAQAVVQIPGGYLADKYGRKWLIFTMTTVAGLSRLLYIFAPTWEWIALGGVLTGLSMIYQPAMNALVADSVPAEKRGMAFSLINLIMSVSTTPSPLLSGFLYMRMGLIPSMRLSYALVVLAFLAAAFLRSCLTETLENPKPIQLGEIVSAYPQSLRESVAVWEKVPRTAFVLFLTGVATQFAVQLFLPVFTLYMVDDLRIPELQLSWIMASMFLTMIIFAIPAGKLIDYVGKKKPMILAYLLWAASIPVFVYGDFWRVIASMTMIGLLQVMFGSAASALMADLVPKENRGKVNGSMGFWGMLAGGAGAVMSGWIYDNIGHQAPFWLQYLFLAPILAAIVLLIEEPKRARGDPAPSAA